jgi:hypothetical protein
MKDRITEKQLRAIVERINKVTNSPLEPWGKDAKGNNSANIGNYHLSFAYGGVELDRMVNHGGGVTCPIGSGHTSKRELAEKMWAFLAGLETAKS